MILAVHIFLALSSIILASISTLYPSPSKLYACYGLAGGTLASGTLLVFSSGSHLVEACLSGIFYLAVVSALVIRVQSKLASEKLTNK